MLCLTAAVSIGMTGTALTAAETEKATESVSETVTEKKSALDVDIKGEKDDVLIIKNEAGYIVESALWESGDEENESKKDTEGNFKAGVLRLTGEDKKVHVFEDVNLDILTDPVLVIDNGFLYIQYKNAEGKVKELAETAEETDFKEPVTMYVVSDVYIRAEADGDSEALGVASLGNEIQAVGASPKWYKIKQGELTGYVARAYLSRDKESADAAVKAEEAAIAQAQAEAQAAAAAAAASQQPSQSGSQGVYEVSREAYDDCDGSGHGYYVITYSDGSTATEEY